MLLAIGIILYIVALGALAFRLFVWVLEQFPPIERPFITLARVPLSILFAGGLIAALASIVLLFLAKWYLALVAIPVGVVGMRVLARLIIVLLLTGPERRLALRIVSGEVKPGLFRNEFEQTIGPGSGERLEKQREILKEFEEDSMTRFGGPKT
ncbi:MAG TPA: hypothetical protein VM238_17360 [Phycisphaerae bacterium]|nr:hypothetical protein [Phycisphaerae bacterium]